MSEQTTVRALHNHPDIIESNGLHYHVISDEIVPLDPNNSALFRVWKACEFAYSAPSVRATRTTATKWVIFDAVSFTAVHLAHMTAATRIAHCKIRRDLLNVSINHLCKLSWRTFVSYEIRPTSTTSSFHVVERFVSPRNLSLFGILSLSVHPVTQQKWLCLLSPLGFVHFTFNHTDMILFSKKR